jgi:hypothetical protein
MRLGLWGFPTKVKIVTSQMWDFAEWLVWYDALEDATMVASTEFRPYDLKERVFRKFWNANSDKDFCGVAYLV